MKKFWKIRCVSAWTFTIIGMVLGILTFASYFFFRVEMLDKLYSDGVGPFFAFSVAIVGLFRILGALITWTDLLSFPQFHDGES